MSKIHIVHDWFKVKPTNEYVYIHYRLDSGIPMYVGKGVNGRGFSAAGRSKKWMFTAAKRGVRVEIYDHGLTTDQAYALEILLIAKFRNEGIDLCNMTDGGDGRSGFESEKRKKVYCSNGMDFTHAKAASEWLRSIGNENATSKIVSACALGRKKSVYGYSFSHDSKPPVPTLTGRDAQSLAASKSGIPVYSSDGMSYMSAQSAAEALGGTGGGKILMACRGKRVTAYGLTWSFNKDGPFPEYVDPMVRSNRAKFKRVANDSGDVFNSFTEATEWLSLRDSKTYSPSAICTSIRRGGRCGGLRWFGIDRKKTT